MKSTKDIFNKSDKLTVRLLPMNQNEQELKWDGIWNQNKK